MADKKFYRINQVREITGLSSASVYKQIRLNQFPRGVKLTARCTGWPSDAVDQWVQERIEGAAK